jgi:hypothetical protein
MDIHGKYAPLPIQIEKGWPAAAGKAPQRSLHNPSFREQFLHNQRDSAPLKPRRPGQVRARDRLSGTNLVEYKISINLPRHFIRRALLIREGVASRRHPGWLPVLNRFISEEPSGPISQSIPANPQLIDESTRLSLFVAALNKFVY